MAAAKKTAPPPASRLKLVAVVGVVAFSVFIGQRLFFSGVVPEPGSESAPTGSAPPTGSSVAPVQPAPGAARYAGSASCQTCHEREFSAWRDSHHARAERDFEMPADRAAFAASRARAGDELRLGLDEQGPFVSLRPRGAAPELLRPLRWIGVDPLRQVLVEAPGGRQQAFDPAFDPKQGEWFSIFGRERRARGEWGHWSGRGMNWNSNCAFCHNTAVSKGYESASDSYRTTFVEQGVGCESCHGPLESHARGHASGRGAGSSGSGSALSSARMLDACGACHARRSELSGEFRAGDRFDDHFALELPGIGPAFYADGQVHEESYELTSFLASRMHRAGVTCQDCHEPHSSKLLFSGNALCLQCHADGKRNSPPIDPARHTFHAAGSAGDQCVNCHMPQTTYMQRHPRRDHGFTIPDPKLTLEHGVPNACSRCHSDKPTLWAEQAAQKLYGPRLERPTRARALAVAGGARGLPEARSQLLRLIKQEPIGLWRAVSASVLENYLPDPEIVSALLEAARDDDPLTRVQAVRGLERALPAEGDRVASALRQALEDPVRSVRIAAAWALRGEVVETSRAGGDLLAFLNFNADQPTGRLQLGGYELARGKATQAVVHLERAVAWDGASAPLRHELAVALSSAGRMDAAIEQLEAAQRLNPTEAQYPYLLGLAQSEAGRLPLAIRAFERAAELNPRFGRALYNLGLAHDHLGDSAAALKALQRAELVAPRDADIPYAAAVILSKLGRESEATIAAQRALAVNPQFTQARRLLRRR